MAAAAVAAVLALAIPAGSAVAAPSGAAPVGTFGINPAPGATGPGLSYFSMTIRPGKSASRTAVIRNEGSAPATLQVGSSAGTTAGNGGTAYVGAFRACTGAACWLTGLPARVTLPAHGVRQLTFRVRVPNGTGPGQYLAGISVASAAKPAPVKVGSNGKTKAQAIIVETVTVGVAVTVGTLSRLNWKFLIPAVTGVDEGPTARLVVDLHNTGQTFASATGTASCTAAGRRHSFTVIANTILPRQTADIDVNAPGVPEANAVPCTVRLRYDKNQTVSWTGVVAFPAAPRQRIERTGPSSYAIVPIASGPPLWAWILGALIVAGLLAAALVLVTLRRKAHRA
jgi:hypothetical protein